MNLTVENISVVEKADITLDSITVIAGYNGTGKSSISKALYAVLSASCNILEKIKLERINSIQYRIREAFAKIAYEDEEKGFPREWIDSFLMKIAESVKIADEKNQKSKIKIEMDKLDAVFGKDTEAKDAFLSLIEDFAQQVYERPDELYRKFILNKTITNLFHGQVRNLNNNEMAKISLEDFHSKSCLNMKYVDNKMESEGNFNFESHNIFYLEPRHIFDVLSNGKQIQGMDIRYKDLEEKLRVDPRQQEDYVLEQHEEIEHASNLIDSILDDVVKGRLIYENDSFLFKEEVNQIPIHIANTASGLKTLLVLQRLVKNGALRRGDVLIIDEPEMNQHPKWQVIFAEVLVLLGKEMNIKIMLNSHSPYFIRALECKMARYEVLDKGKFYLMQEGSKGRYVAEDVTKNTEKIYRDLYEPLEEL